MSGEILHPKLSGAIQGEEYFADPERRSSQHLRGLSWCSWNENVYAMLESPNCPNPKPLNPTSCSCKVFGIKAPSSLLLEEPFL